MRCVLTFWDTLSTTTYELSRWSSSLRSESLVPSFGPKSSMLVSLPSSDPTTSAKLRKAFHKCLVKDILVMKCEASKSPCYAA